HPLIAPDGLDVVVLLERVHQLQKLLRVFTTNLDLGRGFPGELHSFAFPEHRLERPGNVVETVDAGPDAVTVIVTFDVLGPRFNRGFENLVGVASARRIFDEAEPGKTVADAAAGTEALVADLLVIIGVGAGCLVDGALNIVLGHRLGPRGNDCGAKTRVRV